MGLHDLIAVKAADLHDLLHQGLGHDVHFPVGGLHHGVALIGMQGDGQVPGQGPDGGGPDDEEKLALVQMPQLAQVVVHGELHIHRCAGIVLVFDLSLSQSCLVVGAPIYGLEALVDVAVAVHPAEHPDLLSLKARVHGLVGMLPIAHHAHALEALPLHINVVVGKLVAGRAEIRHAHGLLVELVLLDDGAFNGHTVVIPAGDIGGVVAPHGVHTGNKVLQGLVQGVAHVQGAVGEGRAVVQGKQGLALILFQQLVIQVQLLPVLEHLRLPLGQPRPHGKAALAHVQCAFVLHDVPPYIMRILKTKLKTKSMPRRVRVRRREKIKSFSLATCA